MTGFTRISTVILVVFVLSFLIFTGLTFFQIQANVMEETGASLAQAQEMVSQKLSVNEIETILSHSPHVKVERFSGKLSSLDPADFQYTQFWQRLFVKTIPPILFPMGENQYLIISPNERAEFIQNLHFFWLVLGLFITTSGLLLLTIRLAIKHQLKPLSKVANALNNMFQGDVYVSDSAKQAPAEIQTVVKRFSQLQSALEERQAQLLEVDNKLAMLQEQERSYLAQELHDNVGQLLTTVKAHAYILSSTDEVSVLQSSGQKVQTYCQQISDAIRQLTEHLHPLALDQVSLAESLRKLCHDQRQLDDKIQWNINIRLDGYHADKTRDIHIYRIAQEALNNVLKHAKASFIRFECVLVSHGLKLTVSDNGVGFDQKAKANIGMFSMKNRARCLNGEFELSTSPGKGVVIGLDVPVNIEMTEAV